MTPDRLRECLDLLHWSQRGGSFAPQVGRSEVFANHPEAVTHP
jgi:hypothetical protein